MKIDLSKWLITPTYGERLEENMKYVKYYQTDMAGPNIWQLSSKKKTYSVNLTSHNYMRWNMTGVPCIHGIAKMHKIKLH